MSQLTNEDLVAGQQTLQGIIQAVEIRTTADERDTGPASAALKRLDQTRIDLGSPRDNLTRLTPTLFEAVGVKLNPLQKKQLSDRNFYYMTISVSMVPGSGVQFSQLKVEFDFEPKGEKEALVHTLFPNRAWKDVIHWGAGLKLGMDANLDWSLGLDMANLPPEVKQAIDKLPGELSSQINNKNEYKAVIDIPEFTYKLGRAEIEATGEGNSFCYWNIEKPELKETQTAQFGIIFKAPKKVRKITLTGKAKATTSMPWLTTSLQNVFSALSKKYQDEVEKGLPLGDLKTWELTLPK